MTGHTTLYRYGIFVQGSSPAGGVAVLLIGLAALVMFVVWIGAFAAAAGWIVFTHTW